MNETVKRWPEIRDVNDPYFCTWLQEMAERGLFFENFGILRSRFKKGEPEKRLYRVINKNYAGMTDEERMLYEDAGWEKVCSQWEYTVFTNADVDAPEIYSDRDFYRKSIRGRWIGSVIMLVVICYWLYRSGTGILNLFDGGDYAKKYGYWHNLEGEPMLLDFILLIMGILLVATFVISIIIYAKSAARDYHKEMPEYNIDYKASQYLRAKKINKVDTCLVLGLLICLTIAIVGYLIYEGTGIPTGTDALKYNGTHPVMLKEVSPSDWNGIQPLINDNDLYNAEEGETYYSVDYMAGDESGGIFRESCREQVQKDKVTAGADNDDYQMELFYMSEYKVARNEKIAEEYLAEAIAYDLHGKVDKDALSKAMDTAKINLDGVDYAAYIEKDKYEVPTVILPDEDESVYDAESGTELVEFPNGGKQQNLYLRKGETIEIVQYFGPENIRDKMPFFVKELN